MPDIFSRKKRREIMQAIRNRDTIPEMAIRRLIFSMGYRYRLHVRALPGWPDLVFPGRKKVIFIHGCFWHRHNCRKGRSMPKTRKCFWESKLTNNRLRDIKNKRELNRLGWKIIIIWECEISAKNMEKNMNKIA